MRKINISKYEGNTVYSVHVTDSYGTEHHLGFYNNLSSEIMSEIEADAEMLWQNEIVPEEDLMSSAIANMIEIDKKYNITKGNRDGLD